MLCVAAEENALLRQLAAVLATGNRPVLFDTAWSHGVAALLPPELAAQIEFRSCLAFSGLAGVLLASDDPSLPVSVAAEDGPLIPVFMASAEGYPLYRMLVECVVSINTTAAGGNTTLMTLGA